VPTFKPAYLIHGDDHGRIAERRAKLRALAESQAGAPGIEVLEGDQATPANAAAALSAMTFALGRRFIVVDGAERFKDKEMDALEAALQDLPPDTTIAFFAREDTRSKAPARLHKAVEKAGGKIDAEQSAKPWELPKWVTAQARALGLQIDAQAARELVAQVGERQQRLLRELEKLALSLGPGARVDPVTVDELTAASAERRAWVLADALLSGDPAHAIQEYLALRAQGERVPGLLYWMATRMRAALQAAEAIEGGTSIAEVKKGLRMPPRAADRLISDARRLGATRLRDAVVELADLELASRGGAKGGAGEDTALVLAVIRIAA
jgi:DNA polymerase-3 subunit delta